MLTILKKEFFHFINSLIAYLVILVFLTFIGLYTWVFPESSVLDYGFSELDSLFSFGPIAFLFLVPAITMRSFAEEKKDGTLELLLTQPITDWDLIIGKYLAGLLLVLFALLPTLIYYYSVYRLGNPVGNIDSAAVFSSYIGLLLVGAVFVAVGIFSSLLSTNQIVAFITSLLICYVLYDGVHRLALLSLWDNAGYTIDLFSLDYHYRALSKGVADARNIVYCLSIIVVMLSLSKLKLGSRQW
ncbi:MAG TPA: gliding motility-associated ABC transporter permease subunit GldF [Cytophagaceae bacterium]|jgi:ABC-2 type transport system permease protein|nr:gliding motility-associated ABC transporter permease subunit GldF [Cytophagaceae bacterium]